MCYAAAIVAGYTHTKGGVRIPVPGGKIIEERVGRVSTRTDDVSVAHMIAPPGWSEPAQTPEFAELTIMVRGRMRAEVGFDTVELFPGDTLRTEPGVRVCYSNPYAEESEYWAVCLPAFSLEIAHREPSDQ